MAAAPPPPGDATIERGRYLALAGDCQACHTIDPSRPMAGGYAVPTPFGAIYTRNITADKQTGIGTWSDDDFVRAMQQGIRKDGANLYPAFPYTSFTLLSRADVLAIKAYLFSLPPVHNAVPANHLGFPFNQRWLLWGWKLLNFRDARFHADASKPAEWNTGAYLTQALEHCDTCHTPRNVTLGQENGEALAGGVVGAWSAFNITPDKSDGIGGWSDTELFDYLSTGIAPGKAWAAGPMAQAVEHSLSQIKPEDVRAIVAYLRDRPAISRSGERVARFAFGKPATYEAVLRGSSGITSENVAGSGAELFSANCASCHGLAGTGSEDGYYPPLMHNTSVGASTPNNLVMVVLNGVQRRTAKSVVFMPGFAALSNEQVASLVNFAEQQFGDPTLKVAAGQITSFRHDAGPGPSYLAIGIGAGGSAVAMALVVWGVFVLVVRARRRGAA
jgi:mono/diheme cytochrome c family protein